MQASMSQKGPENPRKPASAAAEKAERLAEALRANLRRRKAAGRARGQDFPNKPVPDEE